MTQNLYIDIHVLQSVPSSNINRDDTGSPKTAIYGGVTRARVSSQSWKHAIRNDFNHKISNIGIRTKMAPTLLAKKLMSIDAALDDDAALQLAIKIFNTVGLSVISKESDKGFGDSKALLLISNEQLEDLAHADFTNLNSKDKAKIKALKSDLKKKLKSNNSLDLAMFGRMVAEDPDLNVDAAVQVAHAVSTHETIPEFDYFTAIDDEKSKNTSASAMLGTIEYNSSTLYRYASINVNELVHNIGKENTVTSINQFIKSFLLSMPTGKQNTFANKTIPNYVLLTVRHDTPINLVSAFEEPVKSNNGYVAKSIKALETEYMSIQNSGMISPVVFKGVLKNTKYDSSLDSTHTDLTALLKDLANIITTQSV